jgi:hypothetical protein
MVLLRMWRWSNQFLADHLRGLLSSEMRFMQRRRNLEVLQDSYRLRRIPPTTMFTKTSCCRYYRSISCSIVISWAISPYGFPYLEP